MKDIVSDKNNSEKITWKATEAPEVNKGSYGLGSVTDKPYCSESGMCGDVVPTLTRTIAYVLGGDNASSRS